MDRQNSRQNKMIGRLATKNTERGIVPPHRISLGIPVRNLAPTISPDEREVLETLFKGWGLNIDPIIVKRTQENLPYEVVLGKKAVFIAQELQIEEVLVHIIEAETPEELASIRREIKLLRLID